MKTLAINGELRTELGKKGPKKVRVEGKVPCVLYGGGENVHFSANALELEKLVFTPHVYVVELTIDGKKYSAILKDLQFHPVSGKVIHLDFYQVTEAKPVVIEIPVNVTGFAEGVKAGGKLSLEMRKLKVKGLISNLPDTLDIAIDSLGLGKTIQVGELSYPNLEILNAKNAVVVAVRLTRAARAAQTKG